MSAFKDAMRRVITGDDATGRSVVIIDGDPSSMAGDPDVGGLFEIWEDAATGPLNPKVHDDLGAKEPVLGPRPGNVQVRWFVVSPTPEGAPREQLNAAVRARSSTAKRFLLRGISPNFEIHAALRFSVTGHSLCAFRPCRSPRVSGRSAHFGP